MKKIITGALALTLINTMAMAEMNDFYVGGGIVYEKLDGADDAGQASELHVGTKIHNNFGVELRVTKTFNEAKVEESATLYAQKINVNTVGVYGTYIYSPTPTFNIIPKVGLRYVSSTTTATTGRGKVTIDETNSGLSLGVDFKYNITPDFGAYAGYTMVSSDVDHFTIGFERRF